MMYIVYKQNYGAKQSELEHKIVIGEENLLPYAIGFVILRVDTTTRMAVKLNIHAV